MVVFWFEDTSRSAPFLRPALNSALAGLEGGERLVEDLNRFVKGEEGEDFAGWMSMDSPTCRAGFLACFCADCFSTEAVKLVVWPSFPFTASNLAPAPIMFILRSGRGLFFFAITWLILQMRFVKIAQRR